MSANRTAECKSNDDSAVAKIDIRPKAAITTAVGGHFAGSTNHWPSNVSFLASRDVRYGVPPRR